MLTELRRAMYEQNKNFNKKKIFSKYQIEIKALKKTIIELKYSVEGSIIDQIYQTKGNNLSIPTNNYLKCKFANQNIEQLSGKTNELMLPIRDTLQIQR